MNLLKVFLILSGAIAFLIGGALLVDPIQFYIKVGISLNKEIGLLSDLRGTGGLILSISAFIFLGSFKKNWVYFSLILSAMVYLSFGFSRIISLIVDGWPGTSFSFVIILELIMGFCSLIILRNKTSQ